MSINVTEESFGDFFRRLRRAKGFKAQKRLAELSGVSQTTISRIEDGSQVPTPETLKALAKVLDVAVFDLMAVAGHYDEEDLLEPISVTKQDLLTKSKATYKRSNNPVSLPLTNTIELEDFTRAPVLGFIAAGTPIERSEYIESYELVESSLVRGREIYCLKIKGDSMIGDGIFDGDIVVVARQEEINSSEIGVVAVNGYEATLKRVKCENDICMLIPSNPSMQPSLVPAKDVKILGKVIQVRRNFE